MAPRAWWRNHERRDLLAPGSLRIVWSRSLGLPSPDDPCGGIAGPPSIGCQTGYCSRWPEPDRNRLGRVSSSSLGCVQIVLHRPGSGCDFASRQQWPSSCRSRCGRWLLRAGSISRVAPGPPPSSWRASPRCGPGQSPAMPVPASMTELERMQAFLRRCRRAWLLARRREVRKAGSVLT